MLHISDYNISFKLFHIYVPFLIVYFCLFVSCDFLDLI